MNEQTASSSWTASIWIAAPPPAVWASVANIANLSRYSPETSRTEWLPGYTSHAVGARFRGYNRNDRHEWHTDCQIIDFTEPTSFGFEVSAEEGGVFATRWHYAISAEGAGTRLSESFESPTLDAQPAEMNPDRRRVLVEMLDETLARIKADIETGPNT